MSYKSELEEKYRQIKARMYGKGLGIVQLDRIKEGREMARFNINVSPYGIAGSTGIVPPQPETKAGLTPLIKNGQTYVNMLKSVAHRHGVDPEVIQGPSKTKKAISARHELWWLANTTFQYSYSRIAKLANRDHTTVLGAVKNYKNRLLDRQTELNQS